MLLSRQPYEQNPQAFVDNFFETLTAGIIPRENFIDWGSIEQKILLLQDPLEFYVQLAARQLGDAALRQELRDSLLAADNPRGLVKCAFELLGHTNGEFVTQQDDINLAELTNQIQAGDEAQAAMFAAVLCDLGFGRVLAREDLAALLLGVQIGLETHRRKNIGGEHFRVLVHNVLNRICPPLGLTVQEEKVINYGNELTKRVDFLLSEGDRQRVGIEVNFYTVSGSKPTEIKRSYGGILRAMEDQDRELVWITDGKGYRAMKRSLRDAVVTFPNIYNLRQMEAHFANDLTAMLNG